MAVRCIVLEVEMPMGYEGSVLELQQEGVAINEQAYQEQKMAVIVLFNENLLFGVRVLEVLRIKANCAFLH